MNSVDMSMTGNSSMPSLSLRNLDDPVATVVSALSPRFVDSREDVMASRSATVYQMVSSDNQYRRDITNEEVQEIARRIPSMSYETVIDFAREGRTFTRDEKRLIEEANESRTRLGKRQLTIRF
jgi:hypothetical protein